MRSSRFIRAWLGSVVVVMWASVAAGQPVATSLGELNGLARTSSPITLTDARGQEFRGVIVDATDSQLSLRIAGAIRRFDAGDVRSVRVRKEDSLVNGALIGAAVSAGLTSLNFLDNECHDDPVCYQMVAVYGGVGALAGLGIDALIHRTVTVYTGRPPAARRRIDAAPIAGCRCKGVRVTLAF